MNKARNNELMALADKQLKASKLLSGDSIDKTYDGKTAALSVSVAMSGLLPTLAIYYQDYDNNHSEAPCRRNVLNVVAKMLGYSDAENLLKYAIALQEKEKEQEQELRALRKAVIDCAIALKQVIRTYTLVTYNEDK